MKKKKRTSRSEAEGDQRSGIVVAVSAGVLTDVLATLASRLVHGTLPPDQVLNGQRAVTLGRAFGIVGMHALTDEAARHAAPPPARREDLS